jgi:hypothetical protein
MAGSPLDQALDELYGTSPAHFTATRSALAKKLKTAGDSDAAATVTRQHKPTQIAFVLNQLARRHSDELADLVDVGRELARAQRKAMRGDARGELREAITRQRTVVAALTAKTASLMNELGVATTGHLDEIARALQAALVDPSVGERLEEGRLEKVLDAAAGFPGASEADAEADADANADADADAKAKASAKADANAKKRHAKADGRHALAAEKQRQARAEATARVTIAEAAEREADGHAAHAKKLAEEAKLLAAEATRMVAEAKVAQRAAAKAVTAGARAEAEARRTRTEAQRAITRAKAIEACL